MANVKEGTKSLKQPAQVIKSTGDTRKIRCKACGNLAVATSDGKGGYVWRCVSCKREYTFQTL